MAERPDAEAVLVTGAFGTGKTSAIEEIADILEARGVRYGAIDLDWLSWFDPGSGGDHQAGAPAMLKNVDAVVGNYYDTGVRRFALARMMETQRDVDDLQTALAMPLTVVRLTLPFDEIERRLSASVTAGRQDDLAEAERQVAEGRRHRRRSHVRERQLHPRRGARDRDRARLVAPVTRRRGGRVPASRRGPLLCPGVRSRASACRAAACRH